MIQAICKLPLPPAALTTLYFPYLVSPETLQRPKSLFAPTLAQIFRKQILDVKDTILKHPKRFGDLSRESPKPNIKKKAENVLIELTTKSCAQNENHPIIPVSSRTSCPHLTVKDRESAPSQVHTEVRRKTEIRKPLSAAK